MLLTPHEHFKSDSFPGYFDCLSGTPPPFVVDYVEVLQRKENKLQQALIDNVGFN